MSRQCPLREYVGKNENGTAVSIEIKEDEVPGGAEIPMGAVPVE